MFFQGAEGPEWCLIIDSGDMHPGPFRPCAGSVARSPGAHRREKLPEAASVLTKKSQRIVPWTCTILGKQ